MTPERSEQSDYLTVTLRVKRPNFDALISGPVLCVSAELRHEDDGYALILDVPYGEQAYLGLDVGDSRLARASAKVRSKLAEDWGSVRDQWPAACEQTMRSLYEKARCK